MPHEHKHSGADHHHASLEDVQDQLRKVFAELIHEVPLYLFTDKEKNSEFNQAAHEVLQTVADLSDKFTFQSLPLNHELAKKWNIDRSPTILFDPENYHIRWLGAPLGEEGRIFIETLVMLGKRSSGLTRQSAKILSEITSPRQVKVFVSMTCPYCPQQAANALKAAIAAPDQISLEIIDTQANTDLTERYSAFSTPITFANELLIGKGAQQEELFLASLDKLEEQNIFIPDIEDKEIEADLVIIGGGPAGLSAGIYAARTGLKSVIIEKGILGGQIATTPEVENYPGISHVGGKTLVEIMVAHALEYCQIFPSEEAVRLSLGERIEVQTTRRRFLTKVLLLATGADHNHLNVPGESELSGRGVSYCSTCDGPQFIGKSVIMVGGGNGAVTEALHLKNLGVDVTLVHRREKLRAQEHLAQKLTSEEIPVLWNTEVQEIAGRDRVESASLKNNRTGEEHIRKLDGVFIAIGYRPEVELAQQIGVELTPDGYIQSDRRHRTNIPGIYSAGDVEGEFKQIVTASAYGAEAAMAIFEDLVNPYWKK